MSGFLKSTETWVTLALLFISGLFFIHARQLPAGTFDPLGSGAAPEMVSGVMIVLCVIVLARALLRSWSGKVVQEDGPIDVIERLDPPTPKAFFSFLILLLLYVLVFHFELAHFVVVTPIFIFLATVALHGFSARTALISAVCGVVISVAMFFILTKFFVIRLPGAF